MKPYEPVAVHRVDQVDPFKPRKIEPAQARRAASSAARSSCRASGRKEPLEAFPLESIQMVGTLTQDKETFALVKAGPNLYQVQEGQLHGPELRRDHRRSTRRDQLKELVQDGAGDWVERAQLRCNWRRTKR